MVWEGTIAHFIITAIVVTIMAFLLGAVLGIKKIRLKVIEKSKGDPKKRDTEAVDTIVAARLEKESATKFGEAIFLSHNSRHGQFGHWVLHAHGYKYELRRDEAHHSNCRGRYAAVIGLSGFDLDSMVGWTALSKEQVDEEFYRVWETFGEYDIFSNNCHDFLRRLSDKIVTMRAPDWDWFRQHYASEHPYRELPALDYQVISTATWIKHLERMKHCPSTTEQHKIDKLIRKLEKIMYANMKHIDLYLAANTSRTDHLTTEGMTAGDAEMVSSV